MFEKTEWLSSLFDDIYSNFTTETNPHRWADITSVMGWLKQWDSSFQSFLFISHHCKLKDNSFFFSARMQILFLKENNLHYKTASEVATLSSDRGLLLPMRHSQSRVTHWSWMENVFHANNGLNISPRLSGYQHRDWPEGSLRSCHVPVLNDIKRRRRHVHN